jgi:hypothetical protein
MLNRGVWLDSAADMSKAFPDLWVSDKAAEHAKVRIECQTDRGVPQTPLGEFSIKGFGGLIPQFGTLSADWVEVAYQPAGQGQKARTAWFDLAAIPDPKQWLTAKIGKLASFTTAQSEAAMPETNQAPSDLSLIETAFEIEGNDTLPLVKVWLAARPALKDLFGSGRTAARAIKEFLNGDLPAHLTIANLKAGTQKVASKALVRVGLSREEIEASLSLQAGKPVTLVDQPVAQPAAPLVPSSEIIVNLPEAWVRLNALSARLDAVNPLRGAAAALAGLSGRREAVKPVAPAADAVENLGIRLELEQPAKVVTLTDAVPGFEPDRAEVPAPIAGNGGCSDEAPVPGEYAPFDWGPADAWTMRWRKDPLRGKKKRKPVIDPGTAPAVVI